jgi:hypothetical protein
VYNRATSTTRLLPGLASHTAVIALVCAVGACLTVSGCSPGVDYPSVFPAVHDMPPPRTEAPLDAQQVQQATEDLIIDRNRLNSEAQSTQSAQSKAPTNSVPKPAKSAAATKNPPANPSPAAAGAQTAGAETK